MKLLHLFKSAAAYVDATTNRTSRILARRTSRRGFLGRLGSGIVGVAALPLLPVERAFGEGEFPDSGDPQACDYWRYCALSGTLCSCCGGSVTSCPPGSEVSAITWVGTCRNPVDDQDYLISYNDCCGKAACNRCDCHGSEREKPLYFPSKNSSVTWCFGAEHRSYHCTVALVIGDTD